MNDRTNSCDNQSGPRFSQLFQFYRRPPTVREPSLRLSFWPRADQPLRQWMGFAPLLLCLLIAHISVLRLPYYWDEAGYYIPAALDFFRHGSLIPITTPSNAHPPLPAIYLSLWWKLFGLAPLITRMAVACAATLGLIGVYRVAKQIVSRDAALVTMLLTAIYPVWFAQSTLAHADIFAAAASLWGIDAYLRVRLAGNSEPRNSADSGAAVLRKSSFWPIAIFLSLAALSKETAIVTPLALGAFELFESWRKPNRRDLGARQLKLTAALFAPLLPLLLWYAYHYHVRGFFFGNPEYVRYNAQATFHLRRIALALFTRVWQLSGHMNLFIPMLTAAAAMLLPPIRGRSPIPWRAQSAIAVIVVANLLLFSVLGGALLTRYLLPIYPLVIVECVAIWRLRVRRWPLLAGLSVTAFVLGILVNPPYRFAPEDNFAYRDSILLDQRAIHALMTQTEHSVVLTAWPMTDYLSKPELGYVHTPVKTIAIEDFSLEQIELARANSIYDSALLFSTKYETPQQWARLPAILERDNRQYFNDHEDLPPQVAANMLEGTLLWQQSLRFQWSAVVSFARPIDAKLATPADARADRR